MCHPGTVTHNQIVSINWKHLQVKHSKSVIIMISLLSFFICFDATWAAEGLFGGGGGKAGVLCIECTSIVPFPNFHVANIRALSLRSPCKEQNDDSQAKHYHKNLSQINDFYNYSFSCMFLLTNWS